MQPQKQEMKKPTKKHEITACQMHKLTNYAQRKRKVET